MTSHRSILLIGLGLAACEQGRRVRYVTTARLVNELVEAADERVLSRVVGRYGRLDLLCLDELGYVQIDPRGAELLFQIITRTRRMRLQRPHPRDRHPVLPAAHQQEHREAQTHLRTGRDSSSNEYIEPCIAPWVMQTLTHGEVLARFGHALSDSTRTRVLLALNDSPGYPADLAVLVGVSRQAPSNHLACVRGCGLVVAVPEGRRMRYELADPRLSHALTDLLSVVLAIDPAACPDSDAESCC